MSTEVAIRASEVPASFNEQMHMATVLADSTLLPAHLRGKPSNVLVVLQGARALDISAFWAFQSMHVVEGKLGLGAELMRAMVIKAGHQFSVIERTAHRAVVEIKRKDKDRPYRAEFTIDDAKAAELHGKGNWKKYPKSMLVARATSIAVRDECPEVLFGMVYTPDELGAETDRDGAPVISEDGRTVLNGQVVTPATPEELIRWASALEDWPLADIPAVWVEVRDRAAVFATPGDGDDSLYDLVVNRVAVETEAAKCRPEVRELFNLCRVLQLGDAKHPDGKESLRDFMVRIGDGLPEECPSTEQEATVVAAEGDGEGPAPEEAQGRPEPVIDTPNAEALRAAAADSWGEDGPGAVADAAQAGLNALADDMVDRMTEGERDAERMASGPVYVGEVVER